jgi:hypothetical protein
MADIANYYEDDGFLVCRAVYSRGRRHIKSTLYTLTQFHPLTLFPFPVSM